MKEDGEEPRKQSDPEREKRELELLRGFIFPFIATSALIEVLALLETFVFHGMQRVLNPVYMHGGALGCLFAGINSARHVYIRTKRKKGS